MRESQQCVMGDHLRVSAFHLVKPTRRHSKARKMPPRGPPLCRISLLQNEKSGMLLGSPRVSKAPWWDAPSNVALLVVGLVGSIERALDLLVREVLAAVKGLGVEAEQYGDAVAGASGNFGGGHPGVEPERYASGPERVGHFRQGRGGFLFGEDRASGSLPDVSVFLAQEPTAPYRVEEPTIIGGAERLDVLTDQAHKHRGDGNRTSGLPCSLLEPPRVERLPGVRPTGSDTGRAGGEQDFPPALFREGEVGRTEVRRFAGAVGRVIEAAEERFQMASPYSLITHGVDQFPGETGTRPDRPVTMSGASKTNVRLLIVVPRIA